MRRREFMTLMFGAAAWPRRVAAQQSSPVARIGVLATGVLDSAEQRLTLDAFRLGLR